MMWLPPTWRRKSAGLGRDAGLTLPGMGPGRDLVLATAVALLVAAPSAAAGTALRYGSRGQNVLLLQRRLAALGYLGSRDVDGVFGDETWHAVVALQGWEQIRRDGVVGPNTRRALARASRPGPWAMVPRALEVDLDRQVLLVVEHGTVRRALHASTAAPPYTTPPGRFIVIRRARKSWSRRYHVWLRDALYFYRGWAIHGFRSVPEKPATHGCIRIPLRDARFVFERTPVGTPVFIRGPQLLRPPLPPPQPPPRAQHTKRRQQTPRSRR